MFGAHLGPIWGPILRDPFRGIGRGPGTHFSGIHLGGSVGALGPIWRPKADILEAEGRHYGGRRPTKWGSGGGAPRNQKSKKPVSVWIILSRLVVHVQKRSAANKASNVHGNVVILTP